jgi:hypothetical protein
LKRAAREVGLSFNVNTTKIMAPSWWDTHIYWKGNGDRRRNDCSSRWICLRKNMHHQTEVKTDIRTGQQCTAVPTPNNAVKTDHSKPT